MLIIAVYLAMTIGYLVTSDNNQPKRQGYWAILFTAVYLIIYLFVAPFLTHGSIYTARLYEFIPLLSLGAILFPQFNRQSPDIVTQTLGWAGLIIVMVILLLFKLFVW